MPETQCYVPLCYRRGGHCFPKNNNLRKQWICAIRRAGDKATKKWEPSRESVICHKHFTGSDYVNHTVKGNLIIKITIKFMIIISSDQILLKCLIIINNQSLLNNYFSFRHYT